jgi:carboxyl-terminal processing protease
MARYMHPDSIGHSGAPLFKTLKHGRTIYGGGGITPDVYIDTDHIRLSECVATSVMNATIEHAIIDLWDIIDAKAIIDAHPTMEAFNQVYELDARLLDNFYQAAGYTPNDISEVDKEYINTLLLATMAEHLYGSNARYYIYGIRFDYMQRQAINIATNDLVYNNIIKGEVKSIWIFIKFLLSS